MCFDRPDEHTLVFGCDACTEVRDFSAEDDDVGDPPNFAKCWAVLKEDGWLTQKPVGFQWEHYCPKCALLAEHDRIPRNK